MFHPCSCFIVVWGKREFCNHGSSVILLGFFLCCLSLSHGWENRSSLPSCLCPLVDVVFYTEVSILGEGLLCHLICFVLGESIGFRTFVSSGYYCYLGCGWGFLANLFFHLDLAFVFVGLTRGVVKLKKKVAIFPSSTP